MPRLDERWHDPRFAIRRLLRMTTQDARMRVPAATPEQATEICARVLPGRLAALSAGGRSKPARAAMLLGPTPRSGTNFIEDLIASHPGAATRPCGLREAPFLIEADRIKPFERGFARRHARNAEAFEAYELLGHAMSGAIARAAANSPSLRCRVARLNGGRGSSGALSAAVV